MLFVSEFILALINKSVTKEQKADLKTVIYLWLLFAVLPLAVFLFI
jgi:hypothetical protein